MRALECDEAMGEYGGRLPLENGRKVFHCSQRQNLVPRPALSGVKLSGEILGSVHRVLTDAAEVPVTDDKFQQTICVPMFSIPSASVHTAQQQHLDVVGMRRGVRPKSKRPACTVV